MIKSDKGIVEIKGTGTDILTDFAIIGKAVVEEMKIRGASENVAREVVHNSLDIVLNTSEDTDFKLLDDEQERINKVIEILKGTGK